MQASAACEPDLSSPSRSAEPQSSAGIGRSRLRRQTTFAFVVAHLLLPLAAIPWLFSWEGLVLVFVGNYVFCSIGIGLCYHRTLCHGSVTLPKWLEYTFAIFGVCSLQDSPTHWVAIHRKHHKYSDDESDPHSPHAGFFWGHVGWLVYQNSWQSFLVLRHANSFSNINV